VHRNPSLFTTAVPFQLIKKGEVIAEVVRPGAVWLECEHCKKPTQGRINFKYRDRPEHLVLCDKCKKQLLT